MILRKFANQPPENEGPVEPPFIPRQRTTEDQCGKRSPQPLPRPLECELHHHRDEVACMAQGITDGYRWMAMWWSVDWDRASMKFQLPKGETVEQQEES